MACGFPYCGGVDCKDCHKPRCNAIEYCDQWPSCSPACPLTSPNAGIKPCPFCGCQDTGLAQMPLRKGWLTVQCSRCEASGPWRTEEDAAIASWNARCESSLMVMEAALRAVMRVADAAKEPCSMDPESPAAIRNGKFASIAQVAAQGLGWCSGPPLDAYGVAETGHQVNARSGTDA